MNNRSSKESFTPGPRKRSTTGFCGRQAMLGSLALVLAIAAVVIPGCPPASPPATRPVVRSAIPAAEVDVRWRAYASRRQTIYLKLDLPVVVSGMRIIVSDPVLMGAAPPPLPPAMPADNETPANAEVSPLLREAAESLATQNSPPARSTTQPGTQTSAPVTGRVVHWDSGSGAGATGGAEAPGGAGGGVILFSEHLLRGGAEGPLVDQLTGQGHVGVDAGSYLVELPATPVEAGAIAFQVKEPMPVFARISVPPGIEPGEYRFLVRIESPPRAGAPRAEGGGRGPGTPAPVSEGAGATENALAVEVSELAIPTEPRVLGVMTTTLARLADLYPRSFKAVAESGSGYFDRGNAEQQAAVARLDALVRAAHREGLALFVEDLAPVVRVDERGQVSLDWDAYDRVMSPSMDGSLFADRVPQPVWLAPIPPRRIRDSATQLWQYIDACAKHFAEKGWVATPAFMHPALAELLRKRGGVPLPGSAEDDAAVRAQVMEMLRLHMPRNMLAVTAAEVALAPGAAGKNGLAHAQLWTMTEGDPRLPPSGLLASESSIRAWPWMCVARGTAAPAGEAGATGVKGFVWRDAVGRSDEAGLDTAASGRAGGVIGGNAGPAHLPLLVVEGESKEAATDVAPPAIPSPMSAAQAGAITPSIRMVWLSAGLNDSALLGLLERRSDSGLVHEVLAGIVGRTGLSDDAGRAGEAMLEGGGRAAPASRWPLAPAGCLFAGWPLERQVWQRITPMLERLALANDPGARVSVSADDPLYMGAKLWLGASRRPVARVSAYDFGLRPGREGDIINARVEVLAENPVDAAAELELHFSDLPGDFDMAPSGSGAGASIGNAPEGAGEAGGTGGEGPVIGMQPTGGLRRRVVEVPAAAAARVAMPLAGHLNSLEKSPGLQRLEVMERHAGATFRMPVAFPIYRIHTTDLTPRLDGNGTDWSVDNQLRVFGEMKVGMHYLARPDLLTASIREDAAPATVRWMYDKDYLYVLARCPLSAAAAGGGGISDDRNSQWPLQGQGDAGTPGAGGAGDAAGSGGTRWWGSDGLQLQLAEVGSAPRTGGGAGAGGAREAGDAPRVVQIAFKPAGVVLVKTGRVVYAGAGGGPAAGADANGRTHMIWTDGAPAGDGRGAAAGAASGSVKYGIVIEKREGRPVGYTVEAAIPRTWVSGAVQGIKAPAWRVNVLWHRAGDLSSMSWSGPVVDDSDVGMMGLLVGE